jgi:hypothetical protein
VNNIEYVCLVILCGFHFGIKRRQSIPTGRKELKLLVVNKAVRFCCDK